MLKYSELRAAIGSNRRGVIHFMDDEGAFNERPGTVTLHPTHITVQIDDGPEVSIDPVPRTDATSPPVRHPGFTHVTAARPTSSPPSRTPDVTGRQTDARRRRLRDADEVIKTEEADDDSTEAQHGQPMGRGTSQCARGTATQQPDTGSIRNEQLFREALAAQAAVIAELKASHAATIAAKDEVKAIQDATIEKLEAALAVEDATTAELRASHALEVARLEASKASVITSTNDTIAALEAAHAMTVAAKDAIILKLEADVAALKTHHAAGIFEVAAMQRIAATQLTDIHDSVMARQTLEIYPVRPGDGRQFAEWRGGRVPPPLHRTFDSAWATAVSGNSAGSVHVIIDCDSEGSLARIETSAGGEIQAPLTLRSAFPSPHLGGLSSFVVVDEYGPDGSCYLGFLPSQVPVPRGNFQEVTPALGNAALHYYMWKIQVSRSDELDVPSCPSTGWVALLPSASAPARVTAAARRNYSAFATTDKVPPVPEGSAVAFRVDVDAGTCRVLFYSPEALVDDSIRPYAKMELRFVATAGCSHAGVAIPARPLPTANSDMELYAAVGTLYAGGIYRFLHAR